MKSAKYFDYVYVLLTILLTVYGQLVLKWRMNMKGQLPSPFSEKVRFMFNAYLDPWYYQVLALLF